MPPEPSNPQLGGLRREHLVAAALVVAVTVVLGFASGLGVRDAGAAGGPQAAPSGPVAGQPQQVGPPSAVAVPAGALRGSPVGVRPGSRGAAETASTPIHRRPAAGTVAAPDGSPVPAAPAPSAPQCTAGALDQILALVAQVLGGATPAGALSASGAVPAAHLGLTALVPATGEVPVLLPLGDRTIPVAGLVPLLDTVAERSKDRTADHPLPAAAPTPAAGGNAAPAAGPAAGPADPGLQLGQLAAVLAPLGLELDPAGGVADPLLAPVLGSLGCTGLVPAGSPEPVR